MTDYTDVFGTNAVVSADAEFQSYSLTANATFNWPYNYSGTGYVLYKMMEISCSNGVVLKFPPASQVSIGEAVLIRNTGANLLTITKNDDSALTTIAAGSAIMIYVTDNTTIAGTYSTIGYGVGSCAIDSASLAGYGLLAIGTVLNAAVPVEVETASWSAANADRCKAFIYTGGTGTLALPAVGGLDSDYYLFLRNNGTGTLTIDPDGSETIDDASTMLINPGESLMLVVGASGWYTIGYGRSMLYQFTQLVKDVSAGGTITLSTTEASNKLLTFTGSPAADLNVVVPAVVAIYYINSALSTSKIVTIKTAAGTGAAVSQGQRAIVFCDGVNVLSAQTASVSGAIELEDGTVSTPSLKFATDTDTGIYNLVTGVGVTVGGTAIGKFNANGLEITQGYVKLPGATTPSQTAEGAVVWDTDSDLLTVGTGAGRKTMVDTDSTQTLTNKTLTSPIITLPAGTGNTAEGRMEWNTSTDKLLIGTGAAFKTLVNSDDVIAIAQGGTGQTSKTNAFDALAPTTTKGDIIVFNGSDNVRQAIGTDGYLLTADSTQASGLTWTTVPSAEVTLTNVVTLQNKSYTNTTLLTYAAEYDAGTIASVGTKTIVWANGQRQYFTIDGTGAFLTTIVFDWTGCGVGHYQLRIVVADSFAYTLSWSTGTPGGTGWLGNSSAPALYTGGASRSTVFNFFYGAGGFVCGSGNKVGAF